MYQKHELEVIRYEKMPFAVVSGVGESGTSTDPEPVLPDDD